MTTENQSILTELEKNSLCSEIANVADTLKGIESASYEASEEAVLLLVSGLGIHSKTLYAISKRFLETTEIKGTT